MKYLLLLLTLLAQQAQSQELHAVSLREFDMDFYKIANNRDTYFLLPDEAKAHGEEHWTKGVACGFVLDLLKYGNWGLYHSSRVSGNTTNAQFRQVTWQWTTGFQLGEKTQLYWDHMSTHLLDDGREGRYPLHNEFGLRIKFYSRDK